MTSSSKDLVPSPPSCLYHYCSNESLISILHSSTLRLSLLSLSNDYLEGKWIRKLFIDACRARGVADWKVDTLSQSFDILVDMTHAAGFCMSEEGDLLSQWRGYADQGKGVSIGFSGDYLTKLRDVARAKQDFGVSLQRVEYNPAAQSENLTPTIEMIAERADKVARFPGLASLLIAENDEETARKKHSSSVMSMTFPVLLLLEHLYTSKNPAFREEQEWRLIAFVVTNEMLASCDFRASGERIIPYVTVELSDVGVRPIDRVVLGPRNQTPPDIVRALLAKHGMASVAVDRSTASYR